jgi:hypothetical protein
VNKSVSLTFFSRSLILEVTDYFPSILAGLTFPAASEISEQDLASALSNS